MKVCHITSAHEPNDIRIYIKQCRSLKKNGYDVTILSLKKSLGLTDDSINFINVNLKPGRINRFLFGTNALYKKALEIDADIYQAHDPELLYLLYKLKKKGKKVVFDFHEDVYKQILSKTYINKKLRKPVSYIYNLFEKRLVRHMDGILCATDEIANNYNIKNIKKSVIYNYPLLEEFKNVSLESSNRENIIYIGAISVERGIWDIVELAASRLDYNFIVCGKFTSKELEIKVKQISTPNIKYLGFLNRDEIAKQLSQSILGIVLLEENDRYKVSIPIKMFEYMAAGIPVIGNDFEKWKSYLTDNNAGYNINKKNKKDILKAIDYILKHETEAKLMGSNGRKAILEKYNWGKEEKKLIKFYKQVEEL